MKEVDGSRINIPSDVEGDSPDEVADGGAEGSKSKKKKKKKKGPKAKKANVVKPNQGKIPDEIPPPPPESPDETARWEKELVKGAKTHNLPAWGLLEDRAKPILNIFRTPSCKRLELITPRLRLRQCEVSDLTGVRRIKTEPIVQKTQLYGSPGISEIKDSFLTRYIRSRYGRDEYIFAITALDPSMLKVQDPGQVRISNRISTAEGYLGNIALSLTYPTSSSSFSPTKGRVYTQPTFEQMHQNKVEGKLFYEIHPQLWGQGIMSEAFEEVLRFGMEEVGCDSIASDPTTGNEASIHLCVKNGLSFSHETNNSYNKPQLFHRITKEEWWKRNRPDKGIEDRWGGKEVCRWCMNFRLAPPTISCKYCSWAKYCSRECQRADWVRTGGHQAECDVNETS
uniref:MYND-type domain-containing protein n=1 Tax=Kwoniella bestiolae CBS 10118 TaxID=1296100 RepID=A0A1B9FUG1_9TREE|nr:hypothetical protein I302_08044 [Kwoniella bestiolae CBS 10118]OCF22396.1 hypothetical protein I302_08044 [Kwoniella bestiolae CBS 10118]